MQRWLIGLAVALLANLAAPAMAQPVLMVGWCARNITSAAAPIAVAQKLGWFDSAGFRVELYPLDGSGDCIAAVASGSLSYALASVEPLAAAAPKDSGLRTFYTAYQGNIYGIAVPADSPIHSLADLRGRRIGVTAMTSGGVMVARALAGTAGLDPDKDIHIVVVGDGPQAAALLDQGAVDALSLFDTEYALVRQAGVKLRMLDNAAVARFPSNGLVAEDYTLTARRDEAVALARGYAMGTVFTIANPAAAVAIMHQVWPQTVPDGMAEATALSNDLATLEARIPNWKLAAGGATQWGASQPANYDAYIAFLVKNGALAHAVPAADLITNALIPAINDFDAAAIVRQARDYKP